MTINEIRSTIHTEFLAFREEYDRYTRGEGGSNSIRLLDEVEEYLGQHQGKQLRPTLVLLAAKACGHVQQGHILLATAMELLHNATLMHDDVVDESDRRRGDDSVRKRWSNQVAVLCGDFYLAQVMQLLHTVGDNQASQMVAQVVSTMCRGELAQLYWTSGKSVTQDVYLDVIGSKTASLMAVCCELGAMPLSSSAPAPYRQALHNFGYHYGIVFQILDDLADNQTIHDIQMPGSSNADDLIQHHRQLATDALLPLPQSPARQALESLLRLQ